MTDKKERILSAALELFASEGYNATSTSKIAKTAGVSEGLIFRHFENKQGLLKALNTEAENKLVDAFNKIMDESEPEIIIWKIIDKIYNVSKTEYDFWKLHFKLKWQKKENKDISRPLLNKLTEAFRELKFSEPENEALAFLLTLHGIIVEILQDNMEFVAPLKPYLIKKYQLTH